MVSFDPDDDDLPVDEHVVVPETRYEMWNGELVYVPPAKEPHAALHSQVAALAEAHVAPAFMVACDMLTRVSRRIDIAPDVSIYPIARDPRTGGRQLEHLAFEVVSTVSLSKTGERAAALVRRGVRRVFAIDVERARALEWSRPLGTWGMLETSGYIEDEALAAPLPIARLVRAGKFDDDMVRALVHKQNPVLQEILASRKQEGFAEGVAEGAQRAQLDTLRAAVLDVFQARGIEIEVAVRRRILEETDPERLRHWLERAAIAVQPARDVPFDV